MILKICGITNQNDANAAIEGGANAIGFNFYPRSPRYVPPAVAAAIVSPPGVRRVGVFVNEARAHVEEIIRMAALHVAQLHGDEQPADYPPSVAVWKAARVAGDLDFAEFRNCPIEALLLDGPAAEAWGGSGQAFDWHVAACPPPSLRIILAGGLDASNVARAIQQAHPWGVDACSRLESAPGQKDHAKITAFLQAAKAALRA
jgi:phosphoribosylanthranilate isomerase